MTYQLRKPIYQTSQYYKNLTMSLSHKAYMAEGNYHRFKATLNCTDAVRQRLY